MSSVTHSLSDCRVPRPNSRTERPRKPKIGKMEDHLLFRGQKVKVTRPINAETESASYLLNEKACHQAYYAPINHARPSHRNPCT